MTRLPLHLRRLRGWSRLAVEATIGVTDLVETVHWSVTRLPQRGTPASRRTHGITGFVYRSVNGIARFVGRGLDGALAQLEAILGAPTAEGALAPSPERDGLLAALNGVLGDHLEASGNPLAIPMQFRRDGRPLDVAQERGGRILLLLHGLCRSDLQWRRNGHDHGERLAAELGFVPVYLRYNSGRSIAANGRELAQRLEELFLAWPEPVTELVVVAHSMGGLVIRSACQVAEGSGLGWRDRLRKIVFLGTPHHGSPVERGGNWLTLALDATSYTAAFGRLGRLRSAGITDLRHGQVLPREESDRFARGSGLGVPLPLPEGVDCYAAAATLAAGPGATPRTLAKALLGDGLVSVSSALGDHADPERALSIPADRRWIGYDMGHLDLLDRPELYETIREWLRGVDEGARTT